MTGPCAWIAALAVTLLVNACSSSRAPRPSPEPFPSLGMGDGVVLELPDAHITVPPECSGSCEVDFDVWVGEIACAALPTKIALYGGFDGTAGVYQPRADGALGGRDLGPTGESMSWGAVDEEGFRFCAVMEHDIEREGGLVHYQLCSRQDDPATRSRIVQIAQTYRRGPAPEGARQCGILE